MIDVLGYEGRLVVITGCYSGIGRATAELLSELGAEVTGLDIKEPDYSIPRFIQVDMGDRRSVEAAAAQVSDPVTSLFNCAGISSGAGPTEMVVRVDFLGMRHLTELLVPRMASGSSIANVASLDGFTWRSNLELLREFLRITSFDEGLEWWNKNEPSFPKGGYSFSKQAVIVYTMIRGVQLAGRGIRVNSIAPGLTDTPILVDSVKRYGEEYVARVPRLLGRIATPEEQAWPLVLLNSDRAGFVNAQNIWTDGGLAHAFELDLIDGNWLARAPGPQG